MTDNKSIKPPHLPGLDHLRALAITLVFLFHYRLFAHPAWIDTIGSFGWTGVDLFFVLSGYLIANQVFYQLKEDSFSIRAFFIKRFFRILPAYWTVLALYFLAPALREWEQLPPLWKFLTFTQNYGLNLRQQRTFSHAWSLCIEEQFYFLFPLTIIAMNILKTGRLAIGLLVALFLAGFITRYYSWNHFVAPAIATDDFYISWYQWIYYPTYNRLDGLLAGIAIAGYLNFYRSAMTSVAPFKNSFLLAGLVLLSCAYFLCINPNTFAASLFGFPLIALAYGGMVLSAACPGSWLNKFRSAFSSGLATLSYSIYLVHKMTIHLAQEQFAALGIKEEGTIMFLLSMLVTLAGALLLHFTVENVFLRIKDKLLEKIAKTRQSIPTL